MQVYQKDQLAQYDKEKLKLEIALLEEERDALAKQANMGAIAEYRAKQVTHERETAAGKERRVSRK